MVRFLNPRFGAWWNANEFAFLEYAASAIGMLIGIRIGARLVRGDWLKSRAMVSAAIVGGLALPLVGRVGAEVARFRFTSGGSGNG